MSSAYRYEPRKKGARSPAKKNLAAFGFAAMESIQMVVRWKFLSPSINDELHKVDLD